MSDYYSLQKHLCSARLVVMMGMHETGAGCAESARPGGEILRDMSVAQLSASWYLRQYIWSSRQETVM